MPTIEVSYPDLIRLIGYNVDKDKLVEILFNLKCELEEEQEDRLSVELNPDRADMFSAEGVARAVKQYISGKPAELPKIEFSAATVHVEPSVKEVRPYIAMGIVRGVSLDEEAVFQLIQLQEKLHLTHGRRRKKASIGVYNLDAVIPPFTYTALPPEKILFRPLGYGRIMNAGEILRQVDKGREYGWILKGFDKYPLLLDSRGQVLSMPPIINSEETRLEESVKNIVIDVTGTDKEVVNKILAIVMYNILERGGKGEIVKVLDNGRDVTYDLSRCERVRVHLANARRLLGVSLNVDEACRALMKMGLTPIESRGDLLEVLVPPYRMDILHENDVVEDIAIGIGYGNLAPVPPVKRFRGKELVIERAARIARNVMAWFGFEEILGFTLTSKNALYTKMRMHRNDFVELENPVSSEYSVLRTWLLPTLMNALSNNKHQPLPLKLFEVGDVVIRDEGFETKARLEKHLAAVLCDYKAGYEDIQAILYALLEILGLKSFEVNPVHHPSFIPGRTAILIVDGKQIGILGEIHPEVLENWELKHPVAAFEVNLSVLLA